MRKFTCFTLGLLLACAVTVNAQEQKNDQEGYKFTDIKRLPTTSVKSQDRAGTCWSWSTISFLESEIMRMGKDSLSLSPMYVVWNTYHAKGDKYVRMNGHVNFGQGGASADVTWAIRNYGIVPLSLYSGLNYGEEVHVHGELDAILKGYLDAVVSNPNKKLSTAWLRGYDGILNAYLGEKPEKFTWQGKEYTPMTFATDACGLNMDDYVSLTSFTHHPFYTQFALEVEDNWIGEMSYNLPLDELMDHRRDGGGVVDVFRQGNAVVTGIVVIRQAAGAGPDGHVVDAVGPQHRLRRLRAGETPPVGDAAVPLEVSADLRLRPQGQQEHRDQQNAVDIIR